jgi:prepilin-type N-terminal cleavage/methylation domain-containing protein
MRNAKRGNANAAGFTLVELMVVIAILSVVSLLIMVVVQTSTGSMRLASAKGAAADEAREALSAMVAELQYARKNPTVIAGDTYVEVIEAPDSRLPDGVPVELTFQVPTDSTGENFSTPIRYRWVNEDANDNGLLDSGEDTVVVDGLLTRRLVRIADEDLGGTITEVEQAVAGSIDISDFDVTLDGNTLQISVASTKEVQGTRSTSGEGLEARMQTSRITGRVFLHN